MTTHAIRLAMLALAATCLLGASDAWAYIDPGTGSMAFQLLIAGLVAASFAVKTFWKSIRGLLGGRFARRAAGEEDAD
jgi:hypothetical protein